MYCPKCGTRNTEDTKNCQKCGQPLKEKLPDHADKYTSNFAVIGFILAIINFFVFFLLAVPAIVCSFLGLYKIDKSNGLLKGKIFAWSGLIVGIFQLVIFLILLVCFRGFPKPDHGMICGVNLKGIGNAMLVYANDYNDKYPTPDKWCDLLIEYADVSPKQLKCPHSKKEPSTYALNPKAEPSSNPNLVVAFESKPGWNLYGGQELLSTNNHKGDGCNILFNDMHVAFVKPEDVDKLMWDPCDLKKNDFRIDTYYR